MSRVLSDPSWFPWDLRTGSVQFLRVNREILFRSAFLDQRMAECDRCDRMWIPLSTLLKEAAGDNPGSLADRLSPRFVFHTAFCCSTLLMRSLDAPGRTLALRDPLTLLGLADIKRGFQTLDCDFPAALDFIVGLLARSHDVAEIPLIKPTNVCGNLLRDLQGLQDSTVLVMTGDLEDFVISALKRPQESATRLSWINRRFADAMAMEAEIPVRKDRDGLSWIAFQAALAWMVSRRELCRAFPSIPDSRLAWINAANLIATPAEALLAIRDWFSLPFEDEECERMVTSRVWRFHAKDQNIVYSPDTRSAERKLARRMFADRIDRAMAWIWGRCDATEVDWPADLEICRRRQ